MQTPLQSYIASNLLRSARPRRNRRRVTLRRFLFAVGFLVAGLAGLAALIASAL